MPSVFNHQHDSCFGVKRSFCNAGLFQCESQPQDEVQTSKLPELGLVPNRSTLCQSPVNNSIQYSVSSNGYYGYQPHPVSTYKINDSVCEYNDDCEMDVEYNNSQSETVGNEVMINHNAVGSTCLQNKRKRHLPNRHNSEDNTKRMRQEEYVGGGGTSVAYRRTLTAMTKVDTAIDTTTMLLLRKTHGCELYLFERTCDY